MITANIHGGLVESSPVSLTTTTITDVYEAKSIERVCAGFCVVNDTASAVILSVHRYNGTTDELFWKKSIPANDTIIETEIPIKMRDGFKIKATAATASALTITPIILHLA